MKKWMSLGLCVLLLLSLTACDGELACDPLPLPEDEYYHYGMKELELGNLTEAYDLFRRSADPKAAEILEKFAFVPITNLREDSTGMNWLLTYTYDEKGNLLSSTSSGNLDWYYTSDHETVYTYDEQGRMVSKRYRKGELTTVEHWTYDAETGNELTWSYTTGDEKPEAGYTCTYDKNGNLLSQLYWDDGDKATTYGYIYTYDEQNRMLTRDYTTPTAGIHHKYVYAEDGSYYCTEAYTDDDFEGIQYYYYDKEHRELGHSIVSADGEVMEKAEYIRNEKGDLLSQSHVYHWDDDRVNTLKTYTYDEDGRILREQLEEGGEITATTAYTYDAKGNRLTYESSVDPDYWQREVCTYDEQGHPLTVQWMSSTGWAKNTYTYDEKGNRTQRTETGTNGNTTVTYTYDQWGNELTEEMHREDANGDLKVGKQTTKWELRYYPDGVPEQVNTAAEATRGTTMY